VEYDSVDNPDDEIEEFDESHDYDDGNSPNGYGGGREGGWRLMSRLLHRVPCQIESEEKANPPVNEKVVSGIFVTPWLWLRSEALPVIASLLRFTLTDNDVYFLRGVRVW
jgi:hypothetical protein